MPYPNHHSHTTFSDGKAPAETFILEALRQGMTAYGFSDHCPIPHQDMSMMKMAQLPEYLAEIERLRAVYGDRIEIHRSLEVDYLPGLVSVDSPHIREAELDYTIGAVHFVDCLDGDRPWSFQQPEPLFQRGIDEIFGGSARAMVERYYELVREMVTTHPPDIVAHPDRIKKRNLGGLYWKEKEPWYRETVEATLDDIARAGIIMEVNTRGMYRGTVQELYPSAWIMESAVGRGIPLQINSDTHEVEHVTGGFAPTYELLDRLGVRAVHIFRGGRFVEQGVRELMRRE